MNEPYREHPSEEALERFLLNKSPDEELESVETHILACEFCVEQLESLESEIAATKIALQNMTVQRDSKSLAHTARRWKRWFTIPRLSFAATSAVAAAAAILLSVPSNVSITAYRGTETAIVPEGRPLHMHLNAAQIDSGPVKVELADSTGSIVWTGASVVRDDKVDVALPRITHSGAYLLRLYSVPQGQASNDLLREYSLEAHFTF